MATRWLILKGNFIQNVSFLIVCFCVFSCKKDNYILNQTKHENISISDSIDANIRIDSFVTPYRIHLNKTLDSALAYAPQTYSKKDYGNENSLNTAIGNFMADVVFTQGNPIFESRTGKSIDAVLLNHGGIRSVISKGNISSRTAYQVMPFENSIVVAALSKTQIEEMITYLRKQKKAHPISNMMLLLNKDNSLKNVTINNKPIENRTYYIATSDYLVNGGDGMDFFKKNDTIYNLDYKIRNSLIDFFVKTDTINPKTDNRFTKLN